MQSWRAVYTDLYYQPPHTHTPTYTHLFVHACVHTHVVGYIGLGGFVDMGSIYIHACCCFVYVCVLGRA